MSRLRWSRREPPLAVAAVAGTGPVAARLRWGARDRVVAGAALRAAANADWVVILGEPTDLPWADGAVYLGRDSGLLVPTVLAPWPPADLLRDALRRLTRTPGGLVALLPGHVLTAPWPARPVDPDRLR